MSAFWQINYFSVLKGVFVLMLLSPWVKAQDIIVYNAEQAFYSSADLSGPADQRALELSRKVPFEYRVVPVARVIYLGQSIENFCLFAASASLIEKYTGKPAIESVSLESVSYAFIHRRDLTIGSVAELKGKIIGVIRGMRLENHFDEFKDVNLSLVSAVDDVDLLGMLEHKRIDVAFVPSLPDTRSLMTQPKMFVYNQNLPTLSYTRHLSCIASETTQMFIQKINAALSDIRASE